MPKPKRYCTIDKCGRDAHSNGICLMHWKRLQRNGSPSLQPVRSVEKRFWEKVDKSGGEDACWPWQGVVHPTTGYGHFSVSHSHLMPAHRMSYKLAIGEITHGMTIDHLCRIRRCVNPAHLEMVTHRVNLLRGETLAARNAAKTHCPQGHPYNDVNTYRMRNGGRGCRQCRAEADRKSREKRRLKVK